MLLAFERPAGGGAARRRRQKFAAGARRRFPLGMQRRARVRLPGAGARLRRTRADAGRSRRRADQAARGADVLLPPGQGALPGRAGGDAQARARRGGEEKARAGADRGLGRARSRASSARRRSPRCKDELLYAPDRNKPETKAFEQACKETGLSAGAAVRALRPAARRHDFHLKRFLHEFFPARRRRFRRTRCPRCPTDLPLAEVGGLQPGRHRHDRDRRRLLGAAASRPASCASASTSPRRRSASRPARRSTPSRASASRPPTCRGASSPCCPTT